MEDEKKKIAERDEEISRYLLHGARAGALAGVAATAAIFGLQRYSIIIQHMAPSAKLASILSVGIGTSVIAAENAVYQVTRPAISKEATQKHRDWPEFIFHYRHPIVGGTFAAAVAAGALVYSRDPYRSGTQKFMNIRLYGQGLALVALFGTIGLGSIVSQHNKMEERKREQAAFEEITRDVK